MAREFSAGELLTRDEVADYLKLKPVTINKMVRDQEIPFHRLGPRTLRFDKIEIDKWARSRPNAPYHIRRKRVAAAA